MTTTRIYRPSRRVRFAPIVLISAVVGAVAWVALRPTLPPDEDVTIGGNTMGGTWSVKIHRAPRIWSNESLQSRLQDHLDKIEAALTTYDEASPVRRFNEQRAGGWFPVPDDLARAVLAAERMSIETGGAFDITLAPLVNLWGFGPVRSGVRTGEIPSDAAIAAARAHVDYRKLRARTHPPALHKDDLDLEIDLSGIGKGYAADYLASDLDAMGAKDYLIAIGGELRARGEAPGNRPWTVGIEVPTPDTRRVLCSIDLRMAGLSTSGDYRNFIDLAGHRYSHEIDPRTGRPVTGNLASVSVCHPDSAYADAMATALMVLGPDEGQALATRLDVAALFVFRGKDTFESRPTPAWTRLTPNASAR
jgi:thiamine biosynthesis lipoprotein